MKAQARSHGGYGGTRHLFAIGVAILTMLMMGFSQPVGAQAEPVTCDYFGNQEDAQDGLDRNPELAPELDADGNGTACEGEFDRGDAEVDILACTTFKSQEQAQYFLETYEEQWSSILDPDGNGIACEGEFEMGGPPVFERPSCGHYETQAGAQEALEENEENPDFATSLDGDGNGIACEGVFESGPSTVVVCNEAAGTLVEVSQVALDQYSIDFPYHRATQAEIAADTCAVATDETPTGPTVVVCNEAAGTLVEVSQVALDQYSIDFPYHRATQAEIAAGTCAATPEVPRAPTVIICDLSRGRLLEVSPEVLKRGTRSFPSRLATKAEIAADECPITSPVTPVPPAATPVSPAPTPDGDGKPRPVTQLPSTGTGTPEVQEHHAALVAVPMALIVAVLLSQLRNRRSLG